MERRLDLAAVDAYLSTTQTEPAMNNPKTAKLFTDQGDQAVCLPDEFRFEGEEVRIRKAGDQVILEPLDLTVAPAQCDRE